MVKTTNEQRKALKRIADRSNPPITYRDLRENVMCTFFGDGAVTVQWCGMWLCIERDGYTHS